MDMEKSSNYTVVITRAEKQSQDFVKSLQESGFNIHQFSAIEIRTRPLEDYSRKLLAALQSGNFDWLILTSSNAVTSLYKILSDFNQENALSTAPQVVGVKVAVVGDKTSKVFAEHFHREVDLIPARFISEALLEEYEKINLSGKKVLLVIAAKTRNIIKPELETFGAEVSELIAYDNYEIRPPQESIEKLLNYGSENLIFPFFSPSAVASTLSILGARADILNEAKIISIGPITSKALSDKGFRVDHESSNHSEKGVLSAIAEYAPK